MPVENNNYFDKLNEPATQHSWLSTINLDISVAEEANGKNFCMLLGAILMAFFGILSIVAHGMPSSNAAH
jgi:hypothetical protein